MIDKDPSSDIIRILMQNSSKTVLAAYLAGKPIQTALDAPSGDGWLLKALNSSAQVDGIDLYEGGGAGYRHFWKHDLDRGLPAECSMYDAVLLCEGLEHVGNPLLLLRDAHAHLNPGGLMVVTTPSVWYPQARLQYLYKGFFPSFPPLAGQVVPGTHMHITPWNFPQLWTYLKLAGFEKIEMLPEPELTGKHLHERLMAWPERWWCQHRKNKSKTAEEKEYWTICTSDTALLGRHMIVVARKQAA